MENVTETLPVLTAEVRGKRLGKGVADRIRMARAFAFHDLDGVIRSDEV